MIRYQNDIDVIDSKLHIFCSFQTTTGNTFDIDICSSCSHQTAIENTIMIRYRHDIVDIYSKLKSNYHKNTVIIRHRHDTVDIDDIDRKMKSNNRKKHDHDSISTQY